MGTEQDGQTAVITYTHINVENIARGMVVRYETVRDALRACQRTIDHPLTGEAGQQFWEMVKRTLQRQHEDAYGFTRSRAHLSTGGREA
jgi:hypothetical protein